MGFDRLQTLITFTITIAPLSCEDPTGRNPLSRGAHPKHSEGREKARGEAACLAGEQGWLAARGVGAAPCLSPRKAHGWLSQGHLRGMALGQPMGSTDGLGPHVDLHSWWCWASCVTSPGSSRRQMSCLGQVNPFCRRWSSLYLAKPPSLEGKGMDPCAPACIRTLWGDFLPSRPYRCGDLEIPSQMQQRR